MDYITIQDTEMQKVCLEVEGFNTFIDSCNAYLSKRFGYLDTRYIRFQVDYSGLVSYNTQRKHISQSIFYEFPIYDKEHNAMSVKTGHRDIFDCITMECFCNMLVYSYLLPKYCEYIFNNFDMNLDWYNNPNYPDISKCHLQAITQDLYIYNQFRDQDIGFLTAEGFCKEFLQEQMD